MASSGNDDPHQKNLEDAFQRFFQSLMQSFESGAMAISGQNDGALLDDGRPSSGRSTLNRGTLPRTARIKAERASPASAEHVHSELFCKLRDDLIAYCKHHAQSNGAGTVAGAPASQSQNSRRNIPEGGVSASHCGDKGKERRATPETVDLTSDNEDMTTENELGTVASSDNIANDLSEIQIKSSSTPSAVDHENESLRSVLEGTESQCDTDDEEIECLTLSSKGSQDPQCDSAFNLKAYCNKLRAIGKIDGSAYRRAACIMAKVLSKVDETKLTPVLSDKQAKIIVESEDPPTLMVVDGVANITSISNFLIDLETFQNVVAIQDSTHSEAKGRHKKKISSSKLRQIFQASRTPLSGFQGKTQAFQQPVTTLDIKNPDPGRYDIKAPASLSDSRWSLLQILCRRLYEPENGLAIDLHDSFVVLKQEDTIALPHQDRHGTMSFIHCMQGSQLYVYWELNKQEKIHFRRSGASFCGGKPRAVVVSAGQAVIIRPGTVYATIATSDTLSSGGHIWDAKNLTTILRLIIEEVEDVGVTTNKDPAIGLLVLLQEAQRVTRSQRTQKPPPLCYLRAPHSLFDEALVKVKEYCYDGTWQSCRKQRKRKISLERSNS